MRELDDAALELRLRGVLKEHLGALPLDLTVDALDRRREAKGAVRRSARGRGITLLAAAALLIVGGALAAGSGLLRLPTVVPPVPEPSVVAVATASPDTTFPSPTPTVRPYANACAVPPGDRSGPIGPLAWTPESLKEDWPAPVRPEPAGGGSVQPMPPTYLDPTGDTGADIGPCVDIRAVTADTSAVSLKLVSNQPPVVDPAELWIAFGVVIDDDRDGVPDWRYGLGNLPIEVGGLPNRGWRTNLHTGQTDAGPVHKDLFGNGADIPNARYPNGSDASFVSGGAFETTQGMEKWGFEQDKPFYTWASVIANGRVVASDFAPDTGWLVATPGANPGGTYLLEDGDEGFQLPLSMNLPAGWMGGDGDSTKHTVYRDAELIGDQQFFLDEAGLVHVKVRSGVQFVILGDTSDECRAPYGTGVDDVVRYLEDQPKQFRISSDRWSTVSIDISAKNDVMLDGYRGTYVEYETDVRGQTPDDGDGRPCGWPSWEDHSSQLWILDVNGVRLVIDAMSPPGASEAVRAELRQAVESIHFEQLYGPAGVPMPPFPAFPSPPPVVISDPTPTQTPPPLLPPAVGPVPPNARSWTVTVENESSEPATMFVAEGEEGAFRLVGSATPNVVPAGTTMKVTFLFPAKGPDDGWITVNPRLGEGADVGSVGADNIGMPGKIWITADCGGCWVGPAQ